ncbi:type II toxin-antitoxin system death-on-curing family toxin [Yoonia vestfoldensis]|uniref:type II toxin-antitoxin system death-on-curing family toxin n=1 Tax=Yoonia vestfoldensis TaxID=245188 RepID=UPI0012FF6A54|nr:Fic family protein [Yoonia vestfoldensis]
MEEFGGHHGAHDVSTLLGALGRPYHGYHKRIWTKGAALLHGIATAHGFADGNKRTSLLMLFLLYERSHYWLQTRETDRWDDVVVNVVTGEMTQAQLEQFLKERTLRLD